MEYESILYDLADDVAFIRLNTPETLNAMTKRMGSELLHAIDRAEREARAILIGGVGRGFSSGASLAPGGFKIDDPDRDVAENLEGIMNPIILHMRSAGIPVVTAIRGPAAGIGCGIALAGDLIVAGEGALFFQAFRHIGLAPDGGSTYLITRAIGRVRAMEMMLLGPNLPAAKALDWGLINRVVPDDEVDATGLEIARELARGPRSLGFIKRGVWSALDATMETALLNERLVQREAGRSEDFVEGVKAFREKRPPVFKGR